MAVIPIPQHILQNGVLETSDILNLYYLLTNALANDIAIDGGITASSLITANGGLTVPSGQTATVAGSLSVTGSETVASSTITTLNVTGTATVPAATASANPVQLGQFPNSLAGSGYQKLPNGLIIQWQIVSLPSSTSSTGSTSFTYPIAFPNGFLSGQATQTAAVPALIFLGISSPTTSGANLSWNAGSGSLSGGTTCYVMVIGY